ncbi:hypothetical protein F511_34514 [Dorcoceras hygrometricum]|uniref:Uncharacterized protein n=1 Tax=Dorcoceras hygrometricum TaxID=472368 RepID=A0A2Z7D773_9LAMI|nr:hypothetical protein F511_34514 [Dorcoceras hygrometricum]
MGKHIAEESGAQNIKDNVVQPSVPLHMRARQLEEDVEHLTTRVHVMELVLARFQQMNPQTFLGAEGGVVDEGWLEHVEGLFDIVNYNEERRLSLATF